MSNRGFAFTGKEADHRLHALAANPYPGRGIVIGKSDDGESVLLVYWVMGRSDNSRNRVLVEKPGVVKTVPYDMSKVEDPSLIIYNAMRQYKNNHVVSNGDQTDTVIRHLRRGNSFENALLTREYEPDAPNFTPRITVMVNTGTPGVRFDISLIRKDPNSERPLREHYGGLLKREMVPGTGLCIHTYKTDGHPLPSFDTEPYGVPVGRNSRDTAKMFWDVLDADNRVGLAAKQISIADGGVSFTIINRLQKSNL